MELLRKDGSPKGISFRKHYQNNSVYVMRVAYGKSMTDVVANPNYLKSCYERVVDIRLEYLGLSHDVSARKTLMDAYQQFIKRFNIVVEPTTTYIFKLPN